ncbi:MAG: murein biosynthesis integral membrane protein MurJ [Phycisphaerales bacterium]
MPGEQETPPSRSGFRSAPPPPAPAPALAPALSTGFAGFVRIIAFLTLLSRLSGLIRESIAFKVFGASPVWSAFTLAFAVPNVFRRLFGEGALTAAFIPEYSSLLKQDSGKANALARLTMSALLALSALIVLVGEAILFLFLRSLTPGESGHSFVVFTMVMLPYMPLICATAILGGMLQTHGKFAAPAAAPILLSAFMIAAATLWAWAWKASLETSALAVAVSVTLSGFVQLAWCLWALRGVGGGVLVSWKKQAVDVRDNFRAMLKRFIPVTISSGTMQLSVLADQLIAGYVVVFGTASPFGLLPGTAYPIDGGGAAVLSYASRLYQFPLGVFGIAVATAVFPALARAWADEANRTRDFAEIIRRGTRLSLFIGLPATVGLVIVGHNMCAVIYSSEVGRADEIARVANVLIGYSVAVWAYSLTHVFNKAFYAAGDTKTPMRVSLITIACNLVLNLVLIWPLQEAGLAWATTITATGQCVALGWLASRRFASATSPLFNAETRRGVSITILASIIMGCVLIGSALVWPLAADAPWADRALALARDTIIGIGVFGVIALLTKRDELKWLLERNTGKDGAGGGADFG